MGSPLVQTAATILCAHGGTATISPGAPRVTLGGQPAATLNDMISVAGCTFAPGGAASPCVTGQWVTGATRVRIGGSPAVIQTSSATCIPNGTPVTIVMTQSRVKGI